MTAPATGGRVLLTDHPWPDTEIESAICAAAGLELVVAGPAVSEPELVALAGDVRGIITCWAPVTEAMVMAGPELSVVSRLGVGVDNIDTEAAARRGITVTRVPDYCMEEVSDHVVGLVHDWARGITAYDRAVRAGRWQGGARSLRRVRELVIGVWGSGNNGLRTAQKLSSLGCTVLLDDRHLERAGAFASVPVPELLARSDVVSLHIPLTAENRNVVDEAVLEQMQPCSLLVNTSRGGLIDVDALVSALDSGRPGAAALDVLPDEPLVPVGLVDREDVVITPHVAFSSTASVQELRERATQDLVRVLVGEAPHDPYPPPPA